MVGITTIATSDIGLVIKAIAAQGVDLFQVQTSTGVINTLVDSTGLLKGRWDGIATTPTDGLVLENTTAATAGATIQLSPRIKFRGTAWNTTASLSRSYDWVIYNDTTSGSTNNVTGRLLFRFSDNAGAYGTYFTLDPRNAASGTTRYLFGGNSIQNSSSTNVVLGITTTWNQTSTAGGVDLSIARTETAVGSGNQRLIEATVGGTARFVVTNKGAIEITQGASNTGTPKLFDINASSQSTLTASAEQIMVDFDLNQIQQFSTGAMTQLRAFVIQAPTYSFVGASTITDAATVYISGAPTAGTNATITRNHALWVDSGTVRFDGDIDHNGTNLGFYGVTPTPRSSAYTPTNVSADRAYDANATSIDELADVVGTLIADLQLVGIIA